jgi:hypothetical protein
MDLFGRDLVSGGKPCWDQAATLQNVVVDVVFGAKIRDNRPAGNSYCTEMPMKTSAAFIWGPGRI